MRLLGHHRGHVDLGEVGVEDDEAVEFDLDGRAYDVDLLEVPFADRALEAALGGDHAVRGTVGLARVDLPLHFFVIVIEHLQFAHADVSGVARAGVAERQAVVAAGGELEFQTRREVGEILVEVGRAAFARLAAQGAVGHLVILDRTGPAREVLAVEDGLEARLAVGGEDLVGLGAADLADREVAPANGGAVGLEADRALGGDGGLAVVVVLERGVVDGQLAVEPDADAGAGHHDPERVPFAGRLVGQHQRILAGLAGRVVPERAGAELAAVLEGFLIGGVPDLHLRHATEVDARIAFGGHVVFEQQFEVAVILVGRGVSAGARIEDLAVLHRPVLRELLAHLGEHRVLLLARELGDRVRIVTVPAGQVLAIEQRGEAGGRGFREESGGRDGEERGE